MSLTRHFSEDRPGLGGISPAGWHHGDDGLRDTRSA